jgi:hypothetical protein
MTRAVCFACGGIKFGAFNVCRACGQRPISDDSLMLSLAKTDHYFDVTTLERLGRDVRLGTMPCLDAETKGRLLPQVERAKAMLGLERVRNAANPDGASPPDDAAPWWRFWHRRSPRG